MRTSRLYITILTFTLLVATVAQAQSKSLTAGKEAQKHNSWCWAAVASNVLAAKNVSASQGEIVNFHLGRTDCIGNTDFNWKHDCNQGASLDALTSIFKKWEKAGQDSSSLSYEQVKSNIDADQAFGMAWMWTGRGYGHALMGYGYKEEGGKKYVEVHDPMPGEGSSWKTYDSVVSSDRHKWESTVAIQGSSSSSSTPSEPSDSSTSSEPSDSSTPSEPSDSSTSP